MEDKTQNYLGESEEILRIILESNLMSYNTNLLKKRTKLKKEKITENRKLIDDNPFGLS